MPVLRTDVTLDRWVPYRNDNRAVRCRLFCLPHAGGAATFYLPWRHLLPPAIDVCPLELPGHGARIDEPPFRQMSALVEALCHVLRPLLTVPFSLFGHSIGACLAYETARRLRSADGERTAHLFVSGRPAPNRPPCDAPLRALCDDDLLVALRQFGGIPPAVMARNELMTALLPAIRADLEMVEKYKADPGECIPCPITAFGGANDHSVDVSSRGLASLYQWVISSSCFSRRAFLLFSRARTPRRGHPPGLNCFDWARVGAGTRTRP